MAASCAAFGVAYSSSTCPRKQDLGICVTKIMRGMFKTSARVQNSKCGHHQFLTGKICSTKLHATDFLGAPELKKHFSL